MSKSAQWVATVKWKDPAGKTHTEVRLYPVTFNHGKAMQLDRTRVVRDLVPPDCTTTSISIRRKR